MSFKPYINSLEMSHGTTVAVTRSGVVVFVGPNNSGKSVSLRDIMGHLTRHQTPPLAAKSIEFDKGGSAEDLGSWLDEHAHKTYSEREDQYSRGGQGPRRGNILVNLWNSGPPFQDLGNMLLFFAGGAGRLDASNGAKSIDFLTDRPTHPLHFLYLDPELEKKFSDVSSRAFRSTNRWKTIPATIPLSNINRTATLDPYGATENPLAANKKFRGFITTGAEDLAGNPLANKFIWTFPTGG